MDIEEIMKAFANDEFCVCVTSVDEAVKFMATCADHGFRWWWTQDNGDPVKGFPYDVFNDDGVEVVVYGKDYGDHTLGWNPIESHKEPDFPQPIMMYSDINPGQTDIEISISDDDLIDLLR